MARIMALTPISADPDFSGPVQVLLADALSLLMERNLFTVVDMLRKSGLQPIVRVAEGGIEVALDEHVALFRKGDLHLAATWLSACAVMHHPESEYAKLWMLLSQAAAGSIPMHDSEPPQRKRG